MRLPGRATTAVVLLLAAAAPAAGREKSPPLAIPFVEGHPFAESLNRARAEKRPVMVDIYAVWCGPCKLMDQTTFSDKAVGAWAKANVVAVKVDAEKGEGRRLSRRYMVSSFPTVLLLDASGNEIDRLVGVHSPTSFIENARAALAGQTPLLSSLAALKKSWSPREAVMLSQELARRNDVARFRPIAVRLISEEADLGSPEASLHLLTLLAALEDFQGRLDPETSDLVATFLPRAGTDPRRGAIAVILARDQVRRGDLPAARATVTKTLAILGES